MPPLPFRHDMMHVVLEDVMSAPSHLLELWSWQKGGLYQYQHMRQFLGCTSFLQLLHIATFLELSSQ